MGCLEVWEVFLGNNIRLGQVGRSSSSSYLNFLHGGRKEAKCGCIITPAVLLCILFPRTSVMALITPSMPQHPWLPGHWMLCWCGVHLGLLGGKESVALFLEGEKKKKKVSFICSCLTNNVVKSLFSCFKWKMFVSSIFPNACVRMQHWGWRMPGTGTPPWLWSLVPSSALALGSNWVSRGQQRRAPELKKFFTKPLITCDVLAGLLQWADEWRNEVGG